MFKRFFCNGLAHNGSMHANIISCFAIDEIFLIFQVMSASLIERPECKSCSRTFQCSLVLRWGSSSYTFFNACFRIMNVVSTLI